MTLNKITIEKNVYVPELKKRKHLPCGYWTLGRKSDYCVRNALEWAMNKEGLFLLF